MPIAKRFPLGATVWPSGGKRQPEAALTAACQIGLRLTLTVDRIVRISGNLRGNNGDILVNAAIEGLGVILHPTFLVYEALRRKKLVQILADWEADDLTVFAVYPNRKYLPPKVRSFIDFLAERFGPEPYWEFDSKQK